MRRLDRHVPALDGLRAVAVTSVFLHHALGADKTFAGFAVVRRGHLGVDAFFVLSGFLITLRLYALVEGAVPAAAGGRALVARWRAFFVRRAARTLPLYYAVLLAVALVGPLVGVGVAPAAWPFYLTLTFNLDAFWRSAWAGPGFHLWSLCVEEQFYLCFPPLVLTRARRVLPAALLIAAGSSLALRLAVAGTLSGRGAWAGVLPVLHLDSLGAGAFVGWLVAHDRAGRPAVARALDAVGLVAAALVVAIVTTEPQPPSVDALLAPLLSIAVAALVAGLWEGRLRPLTAVLAARPAVALGRISYGVYVFHVFALQAVWPGRVPSRGAAALADGAIALAVTLALAALSWRLFERPIVARARAATAP